MSWAIVRETDSRRAIIFLCLCASQSLVWTCDKFATTVSTFVLRNTVALRVDQTSGLISRPPRISILPTEKIGLGSRLAQSHSSDLWMFVPRAPGRLSNMTSRTPLADGQSPGRCDFYRRRPIALCLAAPAFAQDQAAFCRTAATTRTRRASHRHRPSVPGPKPAGQPCWRSRRWRCRDDGCRKSSSTWPSWPIPHFVSRYKPQRRFLRTLDCGLHQRHRAKAASPGFMSRASISISTMSFLRS